MALASSVAAASRFDAFVKQDATSSSWNGMRMTSCRRMRACSSRASARARPMWPCEARAANDAMAMSTE